MKKQSTNYEQNSALFEQRERKKLAKHAMLCHTLGIVSIGLSLASFSLDSWLARHSDEMSAPMRWLPVYGIYVSGILCGIVAIVIFAVNLLRRQVSAR